MTKKDVPVVHRLLREYLSQFNLVPAMNEREVEHWFLPQENIIDTYLVEVKRSSDVRGPARSGCFSDDCAVFWQNDGKVTDFLSFYTLPSTIMNHPVHRTLKAAYSFYNVHTTTPLIDLMSDALILAKSVCSACLNAFISVWRLPRSELIVFVLFVQKGFDVFNALDLMENKTFLEKLKFGIGDGNLQYYLYNWKCPSMGAEKVRFVVFAALFTIITLVTKVLQFYFSLLQQL